MTEEVEVTDWNEKRIKGQIAEWVMPLSLDAAASSANSLQEHTIADRIVETDASNQVCAATIKIVDKDVVDSFVIDYNWIKMEQYKPDTRWLFQVKRGIVNIEVMDMKFYEIQTED